MTSERKTAQPAIEANVTGQSLALVFSNGQRIELAASQLSGEIQAMALMHGLKQKLVDAAAISRDPATGRAATIETKYEAVREVYERLLAGGWNKQREGGAGASGGLLFRALVRMYAGKKSDEDIRAFLEAKTDAEKAAVRKSSKVAAVIEQIRAESAKDGGVSGDDLLAELA